MKIYGIGIDIVNINRIRKSIKNKAFIKRIFNLEVKKCNKQNDKSSCFAKRFAAKEAFSKALGIGISKGINFKEITIHNIRSGKPKIILLGKTKKIVSTLIKKKNFNIYLSLSDDKPFAIALTIISI